MRKRSLTIAGHRTSIALEPEFWAAIEQMAARDGLSPPELIARIDSARPRTRNLSSALRVAALEHFRARSEAVRR